MASSSLLGAPLRASATSAARFAPRSAPVRHSHVGSAPLNAAPTTSLSILPFPPCANPLRPQPTALRTARSVLVKGPLGQVVVPLLRGVELDFKAPSSAGAAKGKCKEAEAASNDATPVAPDANAPKTLHVRVASSSTSTSAPRAGKKVKPPKALRSQWGLTRALLANAIRGVEEGHTVTLKLVGVGYRAAIETDPFPRPTKMDIALSSNQGVGAGVSSTPTSESTANPPTFFASIAQRNLLATLAASTDASKPPQRLNIRLGYSHPVLIPIPRGVEASVPQPTVIHLKGCDKEQLGLLASQIRAWRKPEPYKGKGVFVGDETIKIKVPKKK